MFNPFVPFQEKMLDGFIQMKRPWLVSQTFKGEIDLVSDEPKTPILLTDYEDLGLARIHYNAITNDKYRYILDLHNPVHARKIREMLSPGSKYRVYAAFIEDTEKVINRLNNKYNKNIRNYVARKTGWRLDAGDVICPKLEVIFGELFVNIKCSSQSVRFKLSDLENY
jgi:hypothetical protein